MQKVKMIAQGRVQGVGFRWGVYTLALELGGITGRVWNNDDGTVEILAQAEGFINLFGLPLTINALMKEKAGLK